MIKIFLGLIDFIEELVDFLWGSCDSHPSLSHLPCTFELTFLRKGSLKEWLKIKLDL